MKHVILFLGLSLSLGYQARAQSKFQVPTTIRMETAEDHKRYHKDIIAAATWLEQTPLDQETDKRKDVAAFVMKWITGTDAVSLGINTKLGEVLQENPDLFSIYAAAYSRYILEHSGKAKDHHAIKAGLTAMSAVYKKGVGVQKSKTLDEIAGLSGNKLDSYIDKEFNQ